MIATLLLPLAAVALRAEGWAGLRPADWAALRFTLWQAAASAALSVLFGIPVARALARRRFPGRGAVILLLGAPFILPVIVAVLGLVAIFGRSGWLGALDLPLYGPQGVILAHVFFNMPLAVRLLLQGWAAIPGERARLGASLGFTARDTFRLLEWPMLRAVVPGVFLVIFLICTTSFAIALALGGGPRATTVELAIYQAFRFDFDLGRATLLAAVQLGIGVVAALLTLRLALPAGFGAGLDRPLRRWDSGGVLRLQDALSITLACTFLLAPLVAVLGEGVAYLGALPASVWWAALRSLTIALVAAGLTVALAVPLALAIARGQGWIELVGVLALCASPLVLGVGLYLLILPVTNPIRLALPVTAAVNVVLSLPFALRALVPAMRDLLADYGRLSAALGLDGLAWLRLVALPRLRRPLGYAAGLAAALAAGDLGVIALFARPGDATLPLALYQLMGSYQIGEAKAAALLLVLLSLGLFWLFERGAQWKS